MWKVTEHKRSNQQQELNVVSLVKEMAEYTFASYAQQFIDSFKERLSEISRQNNFSADLLYRATQRNLKSIEIWKMDVQGDFKYKMFTLDYVDES